MRIVVAQDSERTAIAAPAPVKKAPETHESSVLFNQALELLSRNRTREAMASLEEAIQIAPRNALYLSHYGLVVAMEREDYDAALKLCERAVKLDPRNPVTHVNLGKVHRLMGQTGEAYERFLSAWKADSKHPAPAAELSRMGIRRPPVIRFLDRSHWLNVRLGKLRALFVRR